MADYMVPILEQKKMLNATPKSVKQSNRMIERNMSEDRQNSSVVTPRAKTAKDLPSLSQQKKSS